MNPESTHRPNENKPLPKGKKALFAFFTGVAFFFLLEVVLWVFGVRTRFDTTDISQGFSGLRSVYVRDGDLLRTRDFEGQTTFNEESFLAEKPEEALRIFCLGGSSSFGFPWGGGSAFPAVLQDMLRARFSDRTIEVINASGVSYAMHRLQIVAQELLDYDPDIVLVYSGHNEFVETSFFEALRERSETRNRFDQLLTRSRTYSWLYSTLKNPSEEASSESSQQAEQRFQEFVRREIALFDDSEKEAVEKNFKDGLTRLIRGLRRRGVQVAVATVPCNLGDWHPMASFNSRSLDASDRLLWQQLITEAEQDAGRQNHLSAIDKLEKANRLDPDHAEARFLLAQFLHRAGRFEEAAQEFSNACDLDASPIRRTTGIRSAIKEVANTEDALLVDVEQAFASKSPHGIIGFNWIEDYVHPTLEGHQEIAFLFAQQMAEAGWIEGGASQERSSKLFVRLARVHKSKRTRLGFTTKRCF